MAIDDCNIPKGVSKLAIRCIKPLHHVISEVKGGRHEVIICYQLEDRVDRELDIGSGESSSVDIPLGGAGAAEEGGSEG